MAKYDVHVLRGGELVLECQADLLGGLNTRFVVPLRREADAPRPADRLNPVLTIRGELMVMVTHFCAVVPAKELGKPIDSVVEQQDEVMNALDMLISGF